MNKRAAPTKTSPKAPPAVPDHEFTMEDIAAALFERAGIKSGLWRLAVKLRFAALTATSQGPSGKPLALPTGMVSTEGFALFKASAPGDLVFDAAAMNGRTSAKHVQRAPSATMKVLPPVATKPQRLVVRRKLGKSSVA